MSSKQERAKKKAIRMLKKQAKEKEKEKKAKAEARAMKRAFAQFKKEARIKAKAASKTEAVVPPVIHKVPMQVATSQPITQGRTILVKQKSDWGSFFGLTTLLILVFLGLFVGAISFASYISHYSWYETNCSGQMVTISWLNPELHAACESSARRKFIYQIGYISSCGCSAISLILTIILMIRQRN